MAVTNIVCQRLSSSIFRMAALMLEAFRCRACFHALHCYCYRHFTAYPFRQLTYATPRAIRLPIMLASSAISPPYRRLPTVIGQYASWRRSYRLLPLMVLRIRLSRRHYWLPSGWRRWLTPSKHNHHHKRQHTLTPFTIITRHDACCHYVWLISSLLRHVTG